MKTTINLGIFASGTKDGGGSGLRNTIEKFTEEKIADIRICVIISNHKNGGVAQIAAKYKIPFVYFPKSEHTANDYKKLFAKYDLDFVHLSGWLHLVLGLPAKKVFNIHPGTLPETAGLHGERVHKKVLELGLSQTAVNFHFVSEIYDEGPIIYTHALSVEGNNPNLLAMRVNKLEHLLQPVIIKLVVRKNIWLDENNTVRYDQIAHQTMFQLKALNPEPTYSY